MARLFTAASSEYLSANTAAITAWPLTFACWIRPATIATSTAMGVFNSVTDNGFFRMQLLNTGAIRFEAATTAFGGLFDNASTTATTSANVWAHIAGSHDGSNLMVYLNGGNKVTTAHAITPDGIDSTVIGRKGGPSPTNYFDGRIAEVGIWNVTLTDSEIAALAGGTPPTRVRPSSLVGYWAIGLSSNLSISEYLVQESDGTSRFTLEDGSGSIMLEALGVQASEIDYSGYARHLSVTGTSLADHSPTMTAWGFDDAWQPYTVVAAGGTTFYPGIGLVGGVVSTRWQQLAG